MSEPYVGEVRMFAGNFAPQGWRFCDGSVLAISENETLFNLIGTTYGGDGQSTFALPDLRGRFPVHQGSGFTIGEQSGTESVSLTTAQLPLHTHAANANSGGNVISPQSAFWSTDPGGNTAAYTSPPNGNMSQNAIGDPSNAQPHDNLQPFLGINFIISLFGIFPSQN